MKRYKKIILMVAIMIYIIGINNIVTAAHYSNFATFKNAINSGKNITTGTTVNITMNEYMGTPGYMYNLKGYDYKGDNGLYCVEARQLLDDSNKKYKVIAKINITGNEASKYKEDGRNRQNKYNTECNKY